jgi:hypothetical protein
LLTTTTFGVYGKLVFFLPAFSLQDHRGSIFT